MLMFISNIGTTTASGSLLWLLTALLVLCLAVIVVLAVVIVRQRRLIERKNESIVRYVGRYLSLKFNEFPELNKGSSNSELTQIELIKIMQLLKKMLYGCFLLLPTLPALAQERTDTTYVFRFIPTDDMFYVPFGDNKAELERLEECVERNYDAITSGQLPLRVDGYCNSEGSRSANLSTAKLRSNRVKSELITHCGLTEECFITRNHSGEGDYVTVRLTVLVTGNKAETDTAAIERERTEQARLEAERKAEQERIAKEQAEREAVEQAEHERQVAAEQARLQTEAAAKAKPYTLSLRANLLRWATLTPDLGIEWRISRYMGILVNGSWTSWSWNDMHRRYALWEVAPEVRWYIGKEKRGYVGAMFKAGEFNYKFSATGRQGDLMGGGLTGGYQLRLNNALSMDFSLGIGCLHADYEKYTVTDGVRVRAGKECKNWWGPVSAGVTLVWQLF